MNYSSYKMLRCILKSTVNLTFTGSFRCISTSTSNRRNMRTLEWDDTGDTKFKEMRKKSKDPVFAYQDYGYRKPGTVRDDGFVEVIPEMVPELIVPDLSEFTLKPYVTHQVAELKTDEFTAKTLFNAVYKDKIIADFKNNDLLEDGTPKSPSPQESVTAEEALLYARKTGSDIFAEDPEDPDPVDIRYLRPR